MLVSYLINMLLMAPTRDIRTIGRHRILAEGDSLIPGGNSMEIGNNFIAQVLVSRMKLKQISKTRPGCHVLLNARLVI